MSWSVNAEGIPKEVKEQLVNQFASAKSATASYPTEQKTVEAAEQITNLTLDEMIESEFPQVKVSGYGSSSKTDSKWNSKANTQFNLTITPINIIKDK